ncbi:MAG: amidophosphoribosyltransferase [Candidatus Marinimicrobia bacterium]|nr:amidophosphoribosyltransferase [Candidatus Neomarinimicrobiota bacterium]MCF7850147.1 amidophosphoribosyltransferase [Candidatus Neomarinimicrobiota bacterium]
MFDKLNEECGVFGVFNTSPEETSQLIYYGLFALQHRGQESAGIAVSDGQSLNYYKDEGLVQEVFDNKLLNFLAGGSGIGHVRYSTTGGTTYENAQPVVIVSSQGQMALAHNGNLVNTKELMSDLEAQGATFQSSTDSETILKLIAKNAQESDNIIEAIQVTMGVIRGGYSILLLTNDKLYAFRDPMGIRPLIMGKRGDAYVFASESCAIDSVGADIIRDVRPGEIVVVDSNGIHSEQIATNSTHLCSFEYVYFARTDSVIDGLNVYEARTNMGKRLWEETGRKADIVIDIPDSGTSAALGYSEASGIPFSKGFYRNAYIGRTFISPQQDMREIGVNFKLSPIRRNIEGKSVIMIDDSIVRGTTITRIVKSLRRVGAKEVHVMITSPPVKYSCFYGIDTPTRKQLIAARKPVEDIAIEIGADSLTYLSHDGLSESVSRAGLGACMACFDGKYPIPVEETS